MEHIEIINDNKISKVTIEKNEQPVKYAINTIATQIIINCMGERRRNSIDVFGILPVAPAISFLRYFIKASLI